MDISLTSATAKNRFCPPFHSESLLLKRCTVSQWNCSLPSQAKILAQPLFGQTLILCRRDRRDGIVKVKCFQKMETCVVDSNSIDEIYDALASRILQQAATTSNPNFKYTVGLAGPPGSGKTTVASEVVRRINKSWQQKSSLSGSQVNPPEIAAFLPMDGFHLYRSQLDQMEDPVEAHARRGAPWTFNPELLLTCLKKLRSQGSIYAPSFDHGVGDPVEDDIFIGLEHKLVIVEGNYILLEEGTWKEISTMFDEKWFIDIDMDKAMQRVLRRHIATGKSPDEAKWRVEYNDRPNAELIVKLSKKNSNVIIRSVDL